MHKRKWVKEAIVAKATDKKDEKGEKAIQAVKLDLPCPKCHRKDCRCPKGSPRREVEEATDEEALDKVRRSLKGNRSKPEHPSDEEGEAAIKAVRKKKWHKGKKKDKGLQEWRASTMTSTGTGQCVGPRCGETPEEKKARYAKWREENKASNKRYWAKESFSPKFDEVYYKALHETDKAQNRNIYHT